MSSTEIESLSQIQDYVQSLLFKDKVLSVNKASHTNSIYVLITDDKTQLFKILRISDHKRARGREVDSINSTKNEFAFKTQIHKALYNTNNWFHVDEQQYSCLNLIPWLKTNNYQLNIQNKDVYIVDLNENVQPRTRVYLRPSLQNEIKLLITMGLLITNPDKDGYQLRLTGPAKTIMNLKEQNPNYLKYWKKHFESQININDLFDIETDHMFDRRYKSFEQKY